MSQEPMWGRVVDDVSNLKTDMAKVGVIAERLETTIEKLTEVSASVSRLLAAQDERLKAQEKTAERVQELMERRREEVDAAFGKVYTRVNNIEEEVREQIERQVAAITSSVDVRHQQLEARLVKLERWGLIGVGAVLLIGWMVENLAEVTKLIG